MIELYRSSLEQISLTIINWSISILKITLDKDGNERMNLVGSGTLVKINSVHGIITAHHVINLFTDPSDLLGLLLIEGRHSYKHPIQYFKLIEIACPVNEEYGPDIGFIQIPPEIVSEIVPCKGFFDLSTDRDYMLSTPPLLKEGVWFVSGTPNEFTESDNSNANRPAKMFRPFCWLCSADRTYKIGKFDYIETDVLYDHGEYLPFSFGGISGGGLWQVLVIKEGNNELIPVRFLFSGVAFYQSSIETNRRFVRCHGRESVYNYLFEQLKT